MTYNWHKIFENKTDSELFDIHVGRTHLPDNVRKFATKELQNRNFDFTDLTEFRKERKLNSVMDDYYQNDSSRLDALRAIKSGVPFLVFILIVFFIDKIYEFRLFDDIELVLFIILGFLLFILIQLINLKYRKKRRTKILKKLEETEKG